MDLGRLRIFLKIVELRSMSAAATSVHLTQPALSRTLKQLEEELGVLLFDRRGRGLVLTAAGRALVPQAEALLEQAERAARKVARAAERDYADLWIGAIESVSTFVIPRLVPSVFAAYPGIALRLETARSSALLERLRDAKLDLAIVAHSGPPHGLRSIPLVRYDLQFFGRRDLFPNLASVTSTTALKDFPIVEIQPGHGEPGLRPKDSYSYALASGMHAVKSLILAGFGVGDIPRFVLSDRERAVLAQASIEHDQNCHLYLARADHFDGTTPDEMTLTLSRDLQRLLAEPLA